MNYNIYIYIYVQLPKKSSQNTRSFGAPSGAIVLWYNRALASARQGEGGAQLGRQMPRQFPGFGWSHVLSGHALFVEAAKVEKQGKLR